MIETFSSSPAVSDGRGRIADDALVINGVAGVNARFGQPRWDLSAADHHDGRPVNTCVIDWTMVDRDHPDWSQALRELCYHRINTRLPGTQRVSVYTAVREQLRARAFLRWLKRQTNVTAPEGLTQQHVETYRAFVTSHDPEDRIKASGANHRTTTDNASPTTVWNYLAPIASMDRYRAYLTTPLTFRPYGGDLTPARVGVVYHFEENTTQPLPQPVLNSLLTTAIRYVEIYAPQIMRMNNEWLEFITAQPARATFPGWETEFEDCPVLGKPWTRPLHDGMTAVHHRFREEMSHLIAACMVILLYLSAMRPGEGCNLPAACRKQSVDPTTGLNNRCKLRGKPLKKRGADRDVEVDWVVPELVERAVAVLVDLLEPYRKMHGSDRLVLNLDGLRTAHSRSRGIETKGGGKNIAKPGYPLGVTSLNNMVTRLYARVREQNPEAPEYNLTPQQFRRTLARFIAREPGGIIAGQLHYHHVSTALFEGYVGSFDDDFMLDVEDERLLNGIDVMEEMLKDLRSGWKANAQVERLLEDWADARQTILFKGTIDTSVGAAVLNARVRNVASRLHVGALTHCSFNVSTARCLTDEEKEQQRPVPNISACSPDRCSNAAIRTCHVPKWEALHAEVEALIPKARTGPQKTSLKAQAKRYDDVIRKAAQL